MEKEILTTAYTTLRSQKPWSHEKSEILHHRVLPYATLAPWLNDFEFINLYEKIKNHTLVDIYRCFELWILAKQTSKLNGSILEVGVWRGGSGAIIAEATKKYKKKYTLQILSKA